MFTKSSTTKVKFQKDGKEGEQEVPYTVQLALDEEKGETATSLDEAIALLQAKLSEEESKVDGAANLKAVEYINAALEANARQAARSNFLTQLEGPDKAITAMAKKMVAVKAAAGVVITQADAEAQIRAIMG